MLLGTKYGNIFLPMIYYHCWRSYPILKQLYLSQIKFDFPQIVHIIEAENGS